MNAFNTVISHLLSVDIKITQEEKCINLLCSLPNSWDSLVMAIGSNATTLTLEDVVASLLLEEMRRKNMERLTKDALMVRGRPIDRGKGKFSDRRSKSKGRSKSLIQSIRSCRKCGKVGHDKKDCKSKVGEKSPRSDGKENHQPTRKWWPEGEVWVVGSKTPASKTKFSSREEIKVCRRDKTHQQP